MAQQRILSGGTDPSEHRNGGDARAGGQAGSASDSRWVAAAEDGSRVGSTNPSGARARARTGTGWGEGVATKQSVPLGEAEARREKVERE